jgi:hypothetical protein
MLSLVEVLFVRALARSRMREHGFDARILRGPEHLGGRQTSEPGYVLIVTLLPDTVVPPST